MAAVLLLFIMSALVSCFELSITIFPLLNPYVFFQQCAGKCCVRWPRVLANWSWIGQGTKRWTVLKTVTPAWALCECSILFIRCWTKLTASYSIAHGSTTAKSARSDLSVSVNYHMKEKHRALLTYRWQQGRKTSLDLEKEQQLLQPCLSAFSAPFSLPKPASSQCSFQHPVSAWEHSRGQTLPSPVSLWPWDMSSCSSSTLMASSALHYRHTPPGQDRHRHLYSYHHTSCIHLAEGLF